MEKANNGFVAPQQIVAANMQAAKGKTETSILRLILMGILAGMFIAGGACTSNMAIHTLGNAGLARVLGGATFPIGLMMIIIVGGELFTGDCLMIMACVHKKISVVSMLKVLVVVFVSNLAGAILFSWIASVSGQFNYSNGLLGAFTIKVAVGKVNMSFGNAFASGILCNIFVCVAVLMASAAKDIPGKILAVFFPITSFVLCGFEHCVANMYYIPAGIFAKGNEAYAELAMAQYGLTAAQLDSVNWVSFLTKNILPVTLGNIVGGMVFVALPLYVIHGKKIKAEEAK